jgi:hypothetical protein
MLQDENGCYVESPIHVWFSLSYASWLTVPRVLMEAMPLDWQRKMAALLEEYEDTFSFEHLDINGTIVTLTDTDNRFCAAPDWVVNYRHPDTDRINECRVGTAKASEVTGG